MKKWSITKMMIQALVRGKGQILIPEIPAGRLLDIGGGGEGVIAQAGGGRVVAVDKLMSEVNEARGKAPDSIWVVADGTSLPHSSQSIDSATALFSIMYMPESVKTGVFSETLRVLKPGGEFWIWDVNMNTKSDVFAYGIQVSILNVPPIKTIYGVGTKNQSTSTICKMLEETGFDAEVVSDHKYWFFIKARKH